MGAAASNYGCSLKGSSFVTFGIGSAGGKTLGMSKAASKSDPDVALSCEQDLQDMAYYAGKYNTASGLVNFSLGAGTKSSALSEIKNQLHIAKAADAALVLYYTGHGQKPTGDWCFFDGYIEYEEIESLIEEQEVITYIVSDACFSGTWVRKCSSRPPNMFLQAVVSASGPNECAYNRRFAKAFWRGEGIADALKTHPMKSCDVGNSKRGEATREDAVRCWFVDPNKYDVDWKTMPASWRP